ncbi:hypothetical protein HPP92_021845 [Vanilla planifolia]|uniref:Uncharacterized protein n=1 Tax=Vanilla planifolia TaxID=51239 RepID=A0A835PYX4_VANPL|nr:hypothetical protein HPP92_021845 [Vanilla planifolia]
MRKSRTELKREGREVGGRRDRGLGRPSQPVTSLYILRRCLGIHFNNSTPVLRHPHAYGEVSGSFEGFEDALSADEGDDGVTGDKDFIQQDFFCTPDYITPEIPTTLELNKENFACPKSPEKSTRNKRHRKGCSPCILPPTTSQLLDEDVEVKFDDFGFEIGMLCVEAQALAVLGF